jgi:hypothetical protein
MTTEQLANQQVLEKTHLYSSWENKTVGEIVDSWNWNLGIFEIYDEIRDWSRRDQEMVLRYAYDYFDKCKFINELHSHLIGTSLDD